MKIKRQIYPNIFKGNNHEASVPKFNSYTDNFKLLHQIKNISP